MAATAPSAVRDFHPDDGARLREIVHYVMKHTRYTEGQAKKAVIEVLKSGITAKTIVKTSKGKYVLCTADKPEGLHYRIRQPKFSDSSSDSSE
ncbi:uncharacterized protein [Fopius arisanus]|uniref:Uncharacterized protein n=1 Tax=Fopius arisanus TaxID=64838 RepID=A0A9R1TTQ6_9HYME|nr:PREDICTED: uncharacterized protein LOC105274014 [Fopius arisanus]